jgi:hypothetical protein
LGELEASHECIKEDHEELGLAHTKLEKAHSSILEQVKKKEAKKEQVIVSCDVGLTCDIIDESFYKPIVVAPTNLSYSTYTSTSSSSEGFTCDASLKAKNETLKKEVNELTRALGKAYGGEDRLLMCFDSQRASLNKERLGYTPKKGKAVIELNCKNKKSHANVSLIKFDSCYLLTKGTNGVKAKFIGISLLGPKKKAIWVPKNLVTNL